MEKPDLDKLVIYVSRPRKKPEEPYEQVLRSIAILGYCLDRRLEQHGFEPAYESVFKRAHGKTSEGKPISIIVETGGNPLLAPAAKVAEELSKQFPQYCSPVEWRARARMFQHVSVKDLQDIKEGMLQTIERLKHVEDLQEINRAYDYVRTNMPELKLGTLEEESKNWFDVMLALKDAGFSFYAAREAADLFALGKDLSNPDQPVQFYSDKGELKHTNLPTTWNNESMSIWRQMDMDRTCEKTAREAVCQEEKKQRKKIEPFLAALIREGKTDMEIERALVQQKKPRQLISAFMQDVRYLRRTITRAKPPKIEVIISTKKPPILECPPGQYWSDKHGMCIEGPKPTTEAEPAKEPSMQLPKCPEGQYWNDEVKKCLPVKPPKPEPTQPEKLQPEPWNKPTVLSKELLDNIKKES
jgi:hypothetical protein